MLTQGAALVLHATHCGNHAGIGELRQSGNAGANHRQQMHAWKRSYHTERGVREMPVGSPASNVAAMVEPKYRPTTESKATVMGIAEAKLSLAGTASGGSASTYDEDSERWSDKAHALTQAGI